MPSDPYTDDEYDDTYKEVHGDEPARDQYADETTDDLFFPSSAGRRLAPSGWGLWPSRGATDADFDEHGDGTRAGGQTDDRDESRRTGLISLLLVVGLGLFLFPEPATSAIGVGLIAVGFLAWVVDRVA